MNYALLLLCCFLLLNPLMVKGEKEDVIYLENGEIYRGKILNEPESDTVRIETAGRNVKIAPRSSVREITREEIPSEKHFKKSGFINQTGFAVLYGENGENISAQRDETKFRLEMVNGYQINPWVSAGLGKGLVKYPIDPLYLIPVFADIKVRLSNKNIAPFFFARGGYIFTFKSKGATYIKEHSGEYTINGGFGVRFDGDRDYGWYIKGGFNMDNIVFSREVGIRIVENHNSFRSMSIGAGVSF